MAERTLTERELNRSLLARQLLLERGNMSIPRALERVGGIQAQYAPSSYIGLWSRVAGIHRADLTRALERRTAVQGTLMRVTIHLVSARDYPLFAEGLREQRRKWWLRAQRGRPDAPAIAAAARRVRSLLKKEPRRRADLVKELGIDAATWNGLGLWLDLVRVPPSGTWERRRADLYATAEYWLGPSKATEEKGAKHLLKRYLEGFGPATISDAANWAGLPVGSVKHAADSLKLRRFRDESGAELLDLSRAPLPDADTPAPVRFLPTWDATLLVHARRTQILPEKHRTKVFSTKTPHSVNTFLVDGQVAGMWSHERGRVRIKPFGRLSAVARRELDEESGRLSEYLA